MKKMGLFVAVFAVIVSIFTLILVVNYNMGITGNVVYGQTCEESQTILKIYGTNNTHGEVYNGNAGYIYKICYENIFNRAYGGSSPHSCSANNTNLVIRLSNTTNAHAESPSLSNYNTSVCYGDLKCVARNTSCNSSLNEMFVLAISSLSNAHISAESNSNYGIKICCSSGNIAPTSGKVVANITSPIRGDIYFANSTIIFNQSSYGPSGYDNLNYLWDLGDGTTRTQSSFNYTYSTIGPKTITLKVTNSFNSSNYAQDSVEIAIFRTGINVYPLIGSPEDLGTENNKSVKFNGSESYVVNVTQSSGYEFECLGGDCPLVARGYCGEVCPLITDSAGKRGNYSQMFFSWSFGSYTLPQSGNALVNGVTDYRYAGPNTILLELSSLGASASTTNRFTIRTIGECINNGNNYWDGERLFNTIGDNPVTCNPGPTACCPNGYSCNQIARFGSYYCSIPNCDNEFYGNNQRITKCDDYNYVNASNSEKASQCRDDCPLARNTDSLLNQTRANLSAGEILNDYKCVWSNNTCGFYANITKRKAVSGVGDVSVLSLTWTEILDYGECVNGKQRITDCTRNVTSMDSGDANVAEGCISTETRIIDCSSGKVELPFFGVIGFVQTLIVIFFVYFIFYKKRL